jgi:parallel beta-helix repeat protein
VGDTILVYNGTYYENVNVTKQLTLRGIGMPLVNASGRGNAIMLATDGISLEGFTAIGGGYSYREAGIKVISNNNTLIGNDASNNYGQESASGKGIYLVSSSNNTLIGNNANGNKDYAGVGIRLEYSNNNILSSNNANRNDGIGISMESSNNNTLIGNNASIDLRSSSNNTLSATLLT